ncbi:MAG: DUF1192 domain-containing protein [Rickettsiales bacterium]|nr:DUF1192 domain-containing protein [Rickettsiales bacterium]
MGSSLILREANGKVMFDEEENETKKKALFEPANLEGVSVEDMRDYIEDLKAEVARVEQALDQRGEMRSAAEALFS